MNIIELNEQTRADLIKIDEALIALAVMEHRATGNTVRADKATKALNRIAVRYGLVPEDSYAAVLAGEV